MLCLAFLAERFECGTNLLLGQGPGLALIEARDDLPFEFVMINDRAIVIPEHVGEERDCELRRS
jgi:hypothetical protein